MNWIVVTVAILLAIGISVLVKKHRKTSIDLPDSHSDENHSKYPLEIIGHEEGCSVLSTNGMEDKVEQDDTFCPGLIEQSVSPHVTDKIVADTDNELIAATIDDSGDLLKDSKNGNAGSQRVFPESVSSDLEAPKVEVDSPSTLLMDDLALDHKQRVIIGLLQSRLDRRLTVEIFLNLGASELKGISGVGVDKLSKIAAMQRELGERFSTVDRVSSCNDDTSLASTVLEENKPFKLSEWVSPPKEYLALCRLLVRALGQDITLQAIQEMPEHKLLLINGFGKGKLVQLENMGRYIQQLQNSSIVSSGVNEETDKNKTVSTRTVLYSRNEELPLEELEQLILADIQQYLDILNERDGYIFSSRIGYQCPVLTLQAIGEHLPGGITVTRERIRQLQNKIEGNWRAFMRVSPRTLHVNLKSNLSLLRAQLFPALRQCFDDEKGFFEFLEMSCGLKSGGLTAVTHPSFPITLLDDFWSVIMSPAPLEQLVAYIQDRLGHDRAIAENTVYRLSVKNRVEIMESGVEPRQLPKVQALAHCLLDFPDGSDWGVWQQHTNKRGVCRSKIAEERLDGGIGFAVDRGWIYQNGRGSYRHLSYLNQTDELIDSTLETIAGILMVAKAEGRNSLNLSVDVHQVSGIDIPYFEVRHIVRAYGERKGIFFKGKSGADTISLDSEFSLVSQETTLKQLFADAGMPLDRKIIASKIRSQSLGHANFYIDKLLASGDIVRVDEDVYTLTTIAFQSIDVEAIVASAARLIENEARIIEVERVQRHINRELDLSNNKFFYLSLLRVHASRLGYNWHFSQSLLSRSAMEFSSLRDMFRKVLLNVSARDQWADTVSHYCLIERSRLNLALQNASGEIKELQALAA